MFSLLPMLLLAACASGITDDSGPVVEPDDGILRFAVLGDFGLGTPGAGDVAALIKSWEVDFIITLGDNNYPNGSEATIDIAIGQFYSEWIYPYKGAHTPGSEPNRFFPSLGNHDWKTPDAQPYLDYFELPGNERYYDFVKGDVHFFVLDSDDEEPDGITEDSVQGQWFKTAAAASTSTYNVVYFHHPPYSADRAAESMRWDFAGAGMDVVLTGHEHWYERIDKAGMPYVINGLGGALWGSIPDPTEPDSVVTFTGALGAMYVEVTETEMTLVMRTTDGTEVDRFVVTP